MADVYLHSRLAEDVLKELDVSLNKNIVFTGAQGPDPLYYNVFSDYSSKDRYHADRMHDTDTRKMFINMIHSVKAHYSNDTLSYLVGFICHYALDVAIHPYVYYNVGVYKKDKPETKQYRGLHLKFERSIDCVMIEQEQQLKAHKLNLTKRFFPLQEVPADVLQVWKDTLFNTYQKDHGDQMYKEGLFEMNKNLRKIAYDPFGIKKQLYKLGDLFSKNDMFYKDLSFYKHIERYDYLNESNNTWHHPVTNQPFTKSVHDLFQDAKIFALSAIASTLKYLNGEEIDLTTVFTNLSFNTGIDCDDERELQYFNIYRK